MPDYEMKLRASGERVEVTVPSDLVEFHELEGGDPIAFRPTLQDGEIVFDLYPGLGGWANERNLSQTGKCNTTLLRFPKEFAVESGLFDLVETGGAEVKFKTHLQKELTLSLNPPVRPVCYDDVRKLAKPFYTRLAKNTNRYSHQLRIGVPQAWSDEDLLNLNGGEKYATRLAARGGQLVVVLDLSGEQLSSDRSNVRVFFEKDMSYLENTESENYSRIVGTFSKPFAHGLDLSSPTDRKTSVKMWPEPNRIVVQPLPSGRINWFAM